MLIQTLTIPSSSLARSIGVLRPLKDVTVTAGETATFECELSYEGIAVEWFLGRQKMEASERVSQSLKSDCLISLLSELVVFTAFQTTQ